MMLTVNEPETCTAQAGSNDQDDWVPAAYYVPDFEKRVNEALDQLAALEPNWDAQGARSIDPVVIDAARKLVKCLPKNLIWLPAVVPMAKGNLQFEWHEGPRTLELEFEAPNTIHYLKWHPEVGVEDEGTFPLADISRVVALIRWFTRGVAHV